MSAPTPMRDLEARAQALAQSCAGEDVVMLVLITRVDDHGQPTGPRGLAVTEFGPDHRGRAALLDLLADYQELERGRFGVRLGP